MTTTKRFDWRFLLCLTVMAMVGYLIFVGVTAVQDGRAKDHRIDALISSLEHERADAQAERVEAAIERRRAEHERAKLLDGQADLARKYEKLLQRQSALTDYLRNHGIALPHRLSATYTAPPRSTTHLHRRTTHKAPSASSSPSPAPQPGKSGGHRAHTQRRAKRTSP